MINRLISIVFFLLFLHAFLYSQEDYTIESSEEQSPLSENSFSERIYGGGNISFNIYGGYIYLDASPFLGYKITPKYSAGIGVKYIYYGNSQIKEEQLNFYGGNVFTRYKFFKNFIAHAEYELLRVYEVNPMASNYDERTNASMLYLGAAYTSYIGETASVQLTLLYDLIDDPNSPYRPLYIMGSSGPPVLYRIGFSFGF